MYSRGLLAVVLLCCSSLVGAAEPIRFGLHLSAPWSFYNDAAELDGIEYQIVSRIFDRAGFQVEYELHSYSRLLKQFSDQKLDCASPVAISINGAHYSEAYLPFEDVAISLQQAQLDLDTLTELAGKRVVAYQQAAQVLGSAFADAVAKASYLELAERELQLELLFSHRVDVVVGERRVLHYLAAKLAPQTLLSTHHLFAEQAYPAACWQAELITVFNQGLLQLQQSGELALILQQHNASAALRTK
jgi:polar amino acid transport system substrate-binding protein